MLERKTRKVGRRIRPAPKLFDDVMLPGTANTSRFDSSASLTVISEPEYSAASTTTTPKDIPAMIRFRMGKFCGDGAVPRGNSDNIAPFSSTKSASLRFSFG